MGNAGCTMGNAGYCCSNAEAQDRLASAPVEARLGGTVTEEVCKPLSAASGAPPPKAKHLATPSGFVPPPAQDASECQTPWQRPPLAAPDAEPPDPPAYVSMPGSPAAAWSAPAGNSDPPSPSVSALQSDDGIGPRQMSSERISAAIKARRRASGILVDGAKATSPPFEAVKEAGEADEQVRRQASPMSEDGPFQSETGESSFGHLAAAAGGAGICEAGQLQDVDMRRFLEACDVYRRAVAQMGAAVSLVLADFDKNKAAVQQVYEQAPEKRARLREFLAQEMASRAHTPGDGDKCRLKKDSGAEKLQWALRALEFFFTMLKYVMASRKNAVTQAYMDTLSNYHGWIAQTGIKVALQGMPTRDSLLKLKGLAPDVSDERLPSVLEGEICRAVDEMLPLVLRMIEIQKELQLWDGRKV